MLTEESRPTMGFVPRRQTVKLATTTDKELQLQRARRKQLRKIVNLDDFEKAAKEVLPTKYFACKTHICPFASM